MSASTRLELAKIAGASVSVVSSLDPALRKYLATPQGKLAVARSMMQPLRTRRDYERCPNCGATIVVDPAVQRRHPDNGCPFGVLSDVMES